MMRSRKAKPAGSRRGSGEGPRLGRGGVTVWLGAAATALLTAGLVLAGAGSAHASSGPTTGAGQDMMNAMPKAAVNAAPQAAPNPVTTTYTCDLTNYGGGSAMIDATYSFPQQYSVANSWPVNNPDTIELDTKAVTLPSTITGLTDVTSFQVDATVQATPETATTAAISGVSTGTLSNPPTQIPAITSFGEVTFTALGSGSVSLPSATFTITPFAGTTAKIPINCGSPTTTPQDIAITVVKATGSFYKCTETTGGQTLITASSLYDLAFAVSGKQTVGTTDTVTLSSSDLPGFTGLPSGFSEAFSGSLAVQGAQSGSVKIAGRATTPVSGAFKATGTLKLTKAGATTLLIPQTFTETVSGTVQGVSGTFTVACTLQTSPAPTALTLKVAKAAGGGGGGNNGTGNNGGTANGGGTPVGAPATGGGLGLESAVAPAAIGGGAALAAGGGWLLMWARRRAKRRRSA